MQINEVIRKYRKEKNMTQEEMANRLGVTAPAVNKWENGASMPDVALLAPIARLLGVSLDELLSYNENLTESEEANIVGGIYAILNTEKPDVVYQRIVDIVREYPNAENLNLTLTTLLNARSFLLTGKERKKYDEWIQSSFENLLHTDDEKIKMQAVDGLYAFFISREKYEEAEECLEYYSELNPDRKRKLATIYVGTGKYEEAYKALEEVLFSNYQTLSGLLHEIYMVAVKTGDLEKAEAIIEKESAFADLFEMGEYHKNAGRLSLAVAKKDSKMALELMNLLFDNVDTMMDYMKSSLYEHMTFNEATPGVTQMVIATLLKQYKENEDMEFIRKTPGWEKFIKKWEG